ARGYADEGELWSPGTVTIAMSRTGAAVMAVSTESWPTLRALDFDAALRAETTRRALLIDRAARPAQTGIGAELVLAADQFLIFPATRVREAVLAHAEGEEARTVIAGYHWFTDWGR